MWLNIRVFGFECFFCPHDGKAFYLVNDLTAAVISDSQIDLTWDVDASAMDPRIITFYKIYRDGGYVGTSPADERSYTDSGLQSETTYTYTVSAMVVMDEGPPSAPAVATTPSVLTITRWLSAPQHGRGVGEAPLEIPDDGNFSEPRSSGISKLIVAFDEPIDPTSLIPANVEIAGLDESINHRRVRGIVKAAHRYMPEYDLETFRGIDHRSKGRRRR